MTEGDPEYDEEWLPKLSAKLKGRYQYYVVSGDSTSLGHFNTVAARLTLKWPNRRSEKKHSNEVNLKRAPFHFYPIYQWMSTTILIFLAEFLPLTLNDNPQRQSQPADFLLQDTLILQAIGKDHHESEWPCGRFY